MTMLKCPDCDKLLDSKGICPDFLKHENDEKQRKARCIREGRCPSCGVTGLTAIRMGHVFNASEEKKVHKCNNCGFFE